jgi:hypothetical protein
MGSPCVCADEKTNTGALMCGHCLCSQTHGCCRKKNYLVQCVLKSDEVLYREQAYRIPVRTYGWMRVFVCRRKKLFVHGLLAALVCHLAFFLD